MASCTLLSCVLPCRCVWYQLRASVLDMFEHAHALLIVGSVITHEPLQRLNGLDVVSVHIQTGASDQRHVAEHTHTHADTQTDDGENSNDGRSRNSNVCCCSMLD